MSLDPGHDYFNDADYSDYRELVCYERPAAVLLHFEYGCKNTRLWLHDRFDFEWKNGELKGRSNSLRDFLEGSGVVSNLSLPMSQDAFPGFLCDRLSDNTRALLVPYFSRIGGSVIVSSLMLEARDGTLLATSLRGDCFYVRKPITTQELADKIYLRDGMLDCSTVTIPESVLASASDSCRTALDSAGIKNAFRKGLENFVRDRWTQGSVLGAEALSVALQSMKQDATPWEKKAREGFENALLVQLFWPIQFAYRPFLVFLDFLDREGLLAELIDDRTGQACAEIRSLISGIKARSGALSNLAILFGKSPSPRRFESFVAELEAVIEDYRGIEALILGTAGFARPELLLIEPSPLASHVRSDLENEGLAVREISADRPLPEGIAPIGTFCLAERRKGFEQQLAASLNVPHLSEQCVRAGRDKFLMRQLLADSACGTIPYSFLPDDAQIPSQGPLAYPFIAKPNFGFASGGVFLVRDDREFRKAVRAIRALNALVLKSVAHGETGTLCEAYLQGAEFSVDSLTVEGETRAVGICRRAFVSEENFQDHAYILDSSIPQPTAVALELAVAEALRAFGYRNGPSHSEFRYDPATGRFVLLETAFRVGAGGNIGKLIQETTGLPYNALAARAWLRALSRETLFGLDTRLRRAGCFFVPEGGTGGVIRENRGEEFLSRASGIRHYRFAKAPGERLVTYPKGLDYPAVVLAVADQTADLETLMQEMSLNVAVVYE